MASIASVISVGVITQGHYGYRGILRIKRELGRYTRQVGIERLTREDALEDANRARQDCIDINQLPE